MKRKPSEIAAISLVVVGGACCLCLLLAWTALDALGWVVSAPFRLFGRREPAELTLRQVLEDESQAAFTLGEGCAYTRAQGSQIRSAPDLQAEDGFARELSREEVIQFVDESLAGEVFLVEGGDIRLASGNPVQAAFLPGEEVSLRFGQETATDISTTSRSLEGMVAGNLFTGSYYYSEEVSSVIDGQGYEEATNLEAGLACPLQWIQTE